MPSKQARKGKPLHIYWDACVFISYIEGKDLSVLDAILATVHNGSVRLYTSTLSIAEVAYAEDEKQKQRPNPVVEAAIDSFWAGNDDITLVNPHELIMRDARKLMRDGLAQGYSLKPPDAIHLATARRLNIGIVHTYDARLQRYGSLANLSIRAPDTMQPMLAVIADEDEA